MDGLACRGVDEQRMVIRSVRQSPFRIGYTEEGKRRAELRGVRIARAKSLAVKIIGKD